MSRIYVASSWRNSLQPRVVQTLRIEGHSVYDFREPRPGYNGFRWEDIGIDRVRLEAETYRDILTTSPVAAAGFLSDFRAMQWADVCVLVLPCGRSAHLEAGWFCGQGKRCIILTQDGEEPELMQLLATDIAISLNEVLLLLEE